MNSFFNLSHPLHFLLCHYLPVWQAASRYSFSTSFLASSLESENKLLVFVHNYKSILICKLQPLWLHSDFFLVVTPLPLSVYGVASQLTPPPPKQATPHSKGRHPKSPWWLWTAIYPSLNQISFCNFAGRKKKKCLELLELVLTTTKPKPAEGEVSPKESRAKDFSNNLRTWIQLCLEVLLLDLSIV